MTIIKVRRVPKRPYMHCQACYRNKRKENLAPTEIKITDMSHVSIWLCDRHLIQFKQEVANIQEKEK